MKATTNKPRAAAAESDGVLAAQNADAKKTTAANAETEAADTARAKKTAAEPADKTVTAEKRDALPAAAAQNTTAESRTDNTAAACAANAAKAAPTRFVGRFTAGVALVGVGVALFLSMILPRFEILWVLRASPLILVLLGIELLADGLRRDRGAGSKVDGWTIFLCLVLCGGVFGLSYLNLILTQLQSFYHLF